MIVGPAYSSRYLSLQRQLEAPKARDPLPISRKTAQQLQDTLAIPSNYGGIKAVLPHLRAHYPEMQFEKEVGSGYASAAYLISYTHPQTGASETRVLKLTKMEKALEPVLSRKSFRLDQERIGGEFYAFAGIGEHVLESERALVFDHNIGQFRMLEAFEIKTFIDNPNTIGNTKLTLIGTVSKEFEGSVPLDVFERYYAIDINTIQRIAREVLLGLQEIQSKQLMHRDIKPENILINPRTGAVKIIDLGYARRVLSNRRERYSYAGTPNFMAIEMINGFTYDSTVDLYSLGVTLFSLYTGALLTDSNRVEDLQAVHKNYIALDEHPLLWDADEAFKHFLRLLTHRIPRVRLTIEAALQHPFVQNRRV